MAKPIPDAVKKDFLEFCRERYAEGGQLSVACFSPLVEEDEGGNELWEFHASNYDPDSTHDIYELYASVQPEFEIEEHGFDDFLIVKPGEENPVDDEEG